MPHPPRLKRNEFRFDSNYFGFTGAGVSSLETYKRTLDIKFELSELRSYVKVNVAVLGSPSLTVFMVSVDAELET